MATKESENTDIKQLRKELEALDANGKISDYQRDLLKWARNVDRRYAWVVLMACVLLKLGVLGPYRVYGLIFAAEAKEGVHTREEASWPVSMIFTVEDLVGPLVTIIIYHMSFQRSQLIGGLLMSMSNLAAYFSNSLLLDTLLLGIIQGIAYAFLFIPIPEVLNGYFVKNRSFAFGMTICGASVSNFILLPIFQWILANYHWRSGYLGTFCVTCVPLLMVPLLKPNKRPSSPVSSSSIETSSAAQDTVNEQKLEPNTKASIDQKTDNNSNQVVTEEKGSNFSAALIWNIFKTPAFYLISLIIVVYLWIFTIFNLILVLTADSRL